MSYKGRKIIYPHEDMQDGEFYHYWHAGWESPYTIKVDGPWMSFLYDGCASRAIDKMLICDLKSYIIITENPEEEKY